MGGEHSIWLGHGGQRRGPYGVAQVRQWLAEGKLPPDVLGWRRGLPGWLPLPQLLQADAAQPPESIGAPMPPTLAAPARELPFTPYGYGPEPGSRDVDGFPPPPALHWAWAALLNVVTLGLFSYIWPFVQSRWVRRIDEGSRATAFLAGGLGLLVVSALFGGGFAGEPSPARLILCLVLQLAFLVSWYYAIYSMAGSMRDYFAQRGVTLGIGGITLFFFTVLYLQGHMHRLARWQRTGQLSPRAPKAVFWWLFVLLPLLVVAALGIPAYQDYVRRAALAS